MICKRFVASSRNAADSIPSDTLALSPHAAVLSSDIAYRLINRIYRRSSPPKINAFFITAKPYVLRKHLVPALRICLTLSIRSFSIGNKQERSSSCELLPKELVSVGQCFLHHGKAVMKEKAFDLRVFRDSCTGVATAEWLALRTCYRRSLPP